MLGYLSMPTHDRMETPMSLYASMVQRRYWRKHKNFKGFTARKKRK